MRALLAFVLLASLVGGAGALAWMQRAPDLAPGEHALVVAGPEGAIFSGTPTGATPLELLLASGLPVDTERYAGMGTYVRAIAGIRASGASGWVYEVAREGETINGDRAADRFPLAPGDSVGWIWTDDGNPPVA